MLSILICRVYFTLRSCHVRYAFQSESTLYFFLNVKEPLPPSKRELWRISVCNRTRTHNHLVFKRTLWVLISAVHLTVCSCYVRYEFQSKSTLYLCLNVKERVALNKREIWSLSDWNWTRTRDRLVCKRTLNHLVKLATWFSCVVSSYLSRAFNSMFLLCHVRVSE